MREAVEVLRFFMDGRHPHARAWLRVIQTGRIVCGRRGGDQSASAKRQDVVRDDVDAVGTSACRALGALTNQQRRLKPASVNGVVARRSCPNAIYLLRSLVCRSFILLAERTARLTMSRRSRRRRRRTRSIFTASRNRGLAARLATTALN